MFCINCGHKLEDGVRFCEKCGFPVAVSAEEKPAEAAAPVAEEPKVEPIAAEEPKAEPAAEEVKEETPTAAEQPQTPPIPQYTQPVNAQPAKEEHKIFSVISLVGGIFSMMFCWIPVLMIVPEILAAVFGIIGLVKKGGKGMAIAGLILSCVAFVVTFLVGVFVILLFLSEGLIWESFYIS